MVVQSSVLDLAPAPPRHRFPAGRGLVQRPQLFERLSPQRHTPPLREPLSDAELRVARYLSSNLTATEIALELCVSPNTVRTHLRHI